MRTSNEITACGLSCDLCDANTLRIQDSAKYLLKIFEDPMFLGIILMKPEFKKDNFPSFKESLEVLSNLPPCPGCQSRKDCVINQCSNQKEGSCAKCEYLNFDEMACTATPEAPKIPFMPPAPVFFQGISKRYRNWNVQNLKLLADGKHNEIQKRINELAQEGKTSRDLIDKSINLFELKA